MSALIKHAANVAVLRRVPAAERIARDRPSTDPRIALLEARIADLERTLADEREAVERRHAQMEHERRAQVAAARVAGREEATVDDRQRTSLLGRGVEQAATEWRDRLAALDRLAAALAAAAMGKMFGDASAVPDIVAATLAHQIDRIGRHAVVRVEVSARDFTEPAALAASVDLPSAQVVARDDLPHGACRVRLRLGEIELDPTTQWSRIAAALRVMQDTP